MIITAGSFKGRKVKTIQSLDVRPTSSKVRQSIFNMIQSSITDAVMLDLFAGSGIMGLEAASRGAKKVIFVEKNVEVIKILEENLNNYNFEHKIIHSDAIHALDRFSENSFNIILIDPPYNSNLIELSLAKIMKNNLLAKNGLIIIEHSSSFDIAKKLNTDYFEILKDKKYGDTSITIISSNSRITTDN